MATAIDKQASAHKDTALLVARILIGVLFLIAAYNKYNGYAGSTGYFGRLGIPNPQIMLPVVIVFEVIAGILLIIGYQTRLVALLIGAFVIIAALTAHTNFGDGNQLNHFLKNLAIVGGCLGLFVTGAGAHSVDGRK